MHGFLGLGGTPDADLNLVVQLVVGLLLLFGMMLARIRQIPLHRLVQTVSLIVAFGFIASVMVPSFKKQVLPHVFSKIGEGFYTWATVHALVGCIAVLLAVYVLFSAGTNLLPTKLRFTNYKLWMRTTLVVWWVALLLGIGTYHRWYAAGGTPATALPSPNSYTVTLTNFKFTPERLSVPVGATVEWSISNGRHTIEADDDSFKSETLVAGGKFTHRFDQAGIFPYFCGNHGAKGGKAMSGVIVVGN